MRPRLFHPSIASIAGLSALTLLLGCGPKAPATAPEPAPAPSAPESPQAAVLGSWQGSLDLGAQRLKIVWHLSEEDGELTATMDSPDQGAFGLPVDEVRLDGDQLHLASVPLGLRFEGTLQGDRIEGTFHQGGLSLPLTLDRQASTEGPPARPQDPQPPFPYTVEEVRIPSVPGVELAGTLTIPEGEGPFPGVALITGSGPHDRDEALMGHRPFAVLADHLTRAGVVVLRTDDRGFAESTGDFASATSLDFADDAAHTLAWLHARPEVDAVGWIGHSEGGMVAPLAQQRSEVSADFMVLLAGTAVSGREIVLEQNTLLLKASGATAEAIEAAYQNNSDLYDLAIEGGPDARERILERIGEIPELAEAPPAQIEGMADSLLSPWFRFFLAHDPAPSLEALEVPVLALFGELDLQVPPEQNAEPMREALGAQGTVEVFPSLNHLFQPATTGLPAEYGSIEITIDPAVLQRISEWILEL